MTPVETSTAEVLEEHPEVIKGPARPPFDTSESKVGRYRVPGEPSVGEGREYAHQQAGFDIKEYCGGEVPFEIELAEAINRYRFGTKAITHADGETETVPRFYSDLEPKERPLVPPVSEQVGFAASEIADWLDVYSEFPQEISDDLRVLLEVGYDISGRFDYWRRVDDHRRGEENANTLGRFVGHFSHRSVTHITKPQVVRKIRARDRKHKLEPTILTNPETRVDCSALAKDPEVRREAFNRRMQAKVGLAITAAMTQERIALLQEHHLRTPIYERHTEVHEVIVGELEADLSIRSQTEDIELALQPAGGDEIPF